MVAQLQESLREALVKASHYESQLSIAKEELKRTKAAKGTGIPTDKLAKELFKAGYRAMVKQYHPDNGGSEETMAQLVELKKALGV